MTINVPSVALACYVFWHLLAARLKDWRFQILRRACDSILKKGQVHHAAVDRSVVHGRKHLA
ncbi:hypothetical protein [uncultured Tateyamaria sp.]|nr:hypothetical protein [uncultured Tateyamaria sp.]